MIFLLALIGNIVG